MAKGSAQSSRGESKRGGNGSGRPLAVRRLLGLPGWAAALAWYALVMGLFSLTLFFRPYATVVGEPAEADVTAPNTIRVTDQKATQDRRDELQNNRSRIWLRDGNALSRASQGLHQFMNLVEQTDPQNLD